MFDLKRPCVSCPFRRGVAEGFSLPAGRLEEIRRAVAFQCHKTVVYDDPEAPEDENGFAIPQAGDKPQQCAGLMAVLHREGEPNQIMQVAARIGGVDFSGLDPRGEAFNAWAEVLQAHGAGCSRRRKRNARARR